MQLQFVETFHERLRFWRREVAEVSQKELCHAVNQRLGSSDQISVATVSNYERSTEPRASFLGALKQAYPQVSLEWLVSGAGKLFAGQQELGEVLAGLRGSDDALNQLTQRPGMHRLSTLPEPAKFVVLAFLEEVRLAASEYRDENGRAWRDFLQRFSHIFFQAFQSPRHFAAEEVLTDDEVTTYTMAMVAALRPLVVALRSRRAGN